MGEDSAAFLNSIPEESLVAVIQALGRARQSEHFPFLVALYEHVGYYAKYSIINAVHSEPAMESEFLHRLIDTESDTSLRNAAIYALGLTGYAKDFEPLIEFCATEVETDALTYSIEALGDLVSFDRLGKRKRKKAVEVVLGFLRHPEPEVRLASIVALWNIADPSVIPDLQKVSKEDFSDLPQPFGTVSAEAKKAIRHIRKEEKKGWNR